MNVAVMPIHRALATLAAAVIGLAGLAAAAPARASADPTAVPAEVAARTTTPPTGASVYRAVPQDSSAVVLGSGDFPVHGDGVGDDTAAIQAAIDEASRRGGANWLGNIVGGARDLDVGDGGGVVFVPEGRYRITDRIDLHASVRVIGFGIERPEFYVAPGTAAYQGVAPGGEQFVFAATRRPVDFDGATSFGNNDTFGTGLVNVDITVAEGNPGAVGVRFSGAQMFVLQDVDIDMGDGYAGIDHNANLIQRVNVTGGRVGMLAYAASPGWQTTILDSSFTRHAEAAIRLHTDAKLSILRTRFADLPQGIEATPAQTQRLYVQDSLFERVAGSAISVNDSQSVPAPSEPELVRAQNQVNLLNTGLSDVGAVLRTQPSGRTWVAPAPSALVRDATLGVRITDALGDGERRSDEVLIDAVPQAPASFERLLGSDVPLVPDSTDWVNVTEFAAARGETVGQGGDDLAIFQAALDAHTTVYVPMGKYLLSDTLELGPENNLVGLHPRQTWLAIPDRAPGFDDPDAPRAILSTPLGGRNVVHGLGLDTSRTNPGAAQVHWRSGANSLLSDIATQFVKWAPEETKPGDPTTGDPGYEYRGRTKYNFWVDGGGGTLLNLWAVAGWADNGLLIENTDVPGRLYEVSVEHHEHREVVLRNVTGWELHALQTEDHIYGWRSQAVEIADSRDLLFGNTVFFRVATVLGPYPYAIGIENSSDVVVRGTRGYRNVNTANTRWGATIRDVLTGREVPDLEVAYLGVATDGPPPIPRALEVGLDDADLAVAPGASVTTTLTVSNHGTRPVRGLAVSATGSMPVEIDVPATNVPGGAEVRVPVTVNVPADAPLGATRDIELAVSMRSAEHRHVVPQHLRLRIGGTNLALGAPVTASSTLGANVAGNAVDGQTTGARWISGSTDPAPTLTVDLGVPSDLHALVLHSGVTGSTALRVSGVEVDGLVAGAWRTLGTLTENKASPVMIPLDTSGPVTQVRLRFTRPSPSDTIARVFEAEIFGVPATAPGMP